VNEHGHYIGHFGDESLLSVTCTYWQTRTIKRENTYKT